MNQIMLYQEMIQKKNTYSDYSLNSSVGRFIKTQYQLYCYIFPHVQPEL